MMSIYYHLAGFSYRLNIELDFGVVGFNFGLESSWLYGIVQPLLFPLVLL